MGGRAVKLGAVECAGWPEQAADTLARPFCHLAPGSLFQLLALAIPAVYELDRHVRRRARKDCSNFVLPK